MKRIFLNTNFFLKNIAFSYTIIFISTFNYMFAEINSSIFSLSYPNIRERKSIVVFGKSDYAISDKNILSPKKVLIFTISINKIWNFNKKFYIF